MKQEAWLFPPDTRVDHFSIIRLLGRGGMSEVYLARDTKLGRKVALKVVKPEALGTREVLERFLFEARATARFNHPSIVTIHAVGEIDGRPYVALEYLEGQTLREALEQERPGQAEAVRIAEAVAEALQVAHAAGVLHRDLKPENVMLGLDGRTRVLDFGLASVVPRKDPNTDSMLALTPGRDSAAIQGTPAYMAPELWAERGASEATDVWALGVMLFELLAGRRPFDEDSVLRLGLRVSGPEPAPRLEGPPELSGLVGQCLQKDPGQRPAAREVLAELRRFLRGAREVAGDEDSPFRGMLAFDESHRHFFFGREAEVAAAVERLRRQPVLPIVGPSGAGKSSFVQAGLIPRLRERGALVVLQLRPGGDPFLALALRVASARQQATGPAAHEEGELSAELLARQLRATPQLLNVVLHRLADRRRSQVLLFVDQLEELYTLVPDPDVRRAFMQALCAAADDPQLPVRVVFTMREEFISRLAEGAGVREVLGQFTVMHSPPPEALREILTRPLEVVGYAYDDPRMADEMLAEVRGEVSGLPLLQFAGRQLWDRRDRERRVLRRAVYEEMGGVAGALAQHADGVLGGMTAQEVGLARSLLLRLVTGERTRRVVARERLLEGLGLGAEPVLRRLVEARLVAARQSETADEAELELVHESLVVAWGRYARWIDESREELVFLSEVGQAAELWVKRGQREEEVWQGDALREALKAAAHCTTELPSRVARFLEAGKKKARRRTWRVRGALLAVILGLAAVALVLGLEMRESQRQEAIAVQERGRAEAREADVLRDSAGIALGQGSPVEARAKLRASLELADSAAGRVLWGKLQASPLLLSRTFPDMIFASAFEPDNRHLVAIDYVGNGHRLDLATGEERQFEAFEGRDPYLLSQDGRWLAIARPNGEIVLRDLTTQTTRVLGSHGGPSYGASFSEDLALLATGGMDGRVLVWDVRTGKLLHTLAGHRGQAWPFTFSKSNRWFITGGADHTIRLWDLSSGSLVREIDDWFGTIFPERDLLDTYSPTEGMARKNRVRVWDLAENKLLEEREFPMSQILSGNLARDARYWIRSHQDGQIDYLEYPGWNRFSFPAGAVIQGLFLTRRSDLLVGTDLAGNLRAWRFPSGLPIGVFGHHANLVTGWWGSMDDRFLASASTDKDLSVWDLAALRPERVRTGHAGKVIRLVMSPDGKQLASGGFDKTVRLWDLTTGRSTMVLSGHAAVIQWGLAFSPDSRVVASGSFDKTVRLWDATTGQQLKVLEGHVAGVDSVAFSPDGQLLATATQGLERPLILWDVASGKPIHVLEHRVPGVGTVAFSPDGRTLAAGTSGKKPLLFDVKTFTELPIRGEGVYGVRSGTFSPDGGKLAAGLDVGTIELWDLREGTVRELGRHERGAFGISFHPDGKRLGSASADGTARIWDLETGEYEVIARHRGYDVNSIVFSPDGRLAATSGDDETVRLWDVETRRPVWRAPVLLPRQGEPPEVFTHEGWQAVVEPPQPLAPPPSAWRKAAEQARFGSAANADGVLCLQTFENGLELWDRRGDKMIWREQQKDLGQVLALPRACAWIAGGKAHLVDGQGAPRSLCDQATALGRDGEVLLVACADRVRSFDAAGMELVAQARSIQAGATALARNEYWLLVGQPSGELEALSLASGASALARTFDQPRPSPIRHLVPGPMDTVIVGQDDGSVSLWDLRSGVLLDRFFLHGWVEHLLLDDHKLHAVSDLGDRLVWDLDVLTLGRCELLQAVWKKAPGVWDVGRAVVRAPAPVDGCVPAGNQPAP